MRILFYLSCAFVGLQMGSCMYNISHAKTITLNSDNVLIFEKNFNSESTAQLSQTALRKSLSKKLSGPLYLVLDTPGGSIDAGIEMIEVLNSLKKKVHTVTLFAASMGFQTVQSVNGKRYIIKNGTLMSHKARGGFQGEFPGQLEKRLNFYKERLLRLDIQCVKRTNGKQTLKSYQALYENEYWCDGQKCVNDGFADEVVKVRCDNTLAGKRTIKVQTMRIFGSIIDIYVVKSQCPLIVGPLGVKVSINGQPAKKALRSIKSQEAKFEIMKVIKTKIEELKNKKNVTR